MLTILLKFAICLIRFNGKMFNKNICVKEWMHTNQSGYILCLIEKSFYTNAFISYILVIMIKCKYIESC